MLISLALFFFTLFLSYANGANDNFKGVATLFGSKTTNYKIALWWATITTLAGAMFSVVVANKLIVTFSGKGLVPDGVTQEPFFLLAVAIGAGLTVAIATLKGFPISTTHALVGALVGAGLTSVGSGINYSALGQGFIAPLLISPFVAIVLAALLYIALRSFRKSLGITKYYRVWIGDSKQVIASASQPEKMSVSPSVTTQVDNAKHQVCIKRNHGMILGIGIETVLDVMHFLSAGLVSFARGLNDTPKIMGLILVTKLLDIRYGMILIALAMAIGGLCNAKKVAYVMSRDITDLNHGQGFTANLVTSLLVIFASKLGLPVSTTHVSVGAIFGIGAVNGKANYRVVGSIVVSWVLTLPMAALFAALAYITLRVLA